MTFSRAACGTANVRGLLLVDRLASGNIGAGVWWRYCILPKVFLHTEVNRQNDRYYGRGAQYQHQERNPDGHRVTEYQKDDGDNVIFSTGAV